MSTISQTIPFQAIPGFSKLVGDYITGKPALRHLYKYDFDIDAFEQIMQDKFVNDYPPRRHLVTILQKQYTGINTSEVVRQNISSLGDANTFTVTCAHQPCLLLGPVFNIYKIASTVNLTRQLKERYPKFNFVPIFWMGSEDHDFEELGTTYIYGKKITWPAAEGEGGAYGRRKTQSLYPVLDEALAAAGEGAKPLIDKLRAAIEQFPTFGPYTRYLLNELFGETGLVVIDQDDGDLKLHFSSIIQDELKKSSSIKSIESNIKWLSENYSVQATPREINLFYLQDNSRERILRTNDGYEINNTNQKFTKAEMEDMRNPNPGKFSPNVILRPVYQELILPNLAFIGGAGELSYWLELKPVFEHHKVNYPMLVMRTSMTVLNNASERKLEKLGLTTADFFGNIDQVISAFVKSKLSPDIQFETEKKSMGDLFDSILQKAETIDPTLKGAIQAEKQKQLNALEVLESKIIKAEKRKQEESINQIKALQQIIAPDNSWQERIENFIPFYLKSADYINDIVEKTDPFSRSMLVINLDR
jgi:bacillithiol biosynthesis cysteine-adding enzyme BshC